MLLAWMSLQLCSDPADCGGGLVKLAVVVGFVRVRQAIVGKESTKQGYANTPCCTANRNISNLEFHLV